MMGGRTSHRLSAVGDVTAAKSAYGQASSEAQVAPGRRPDRGGCRNGDMSSGCSACQAQAACGVRRASAPAASASSASVMAAATARPRQPAPAAT
jgi:hypothetical protein